MATMCSPRMVSYPSIKVNIRGKQRVWGRRQNGPQPHVPLPQARCYCYNAISTLCLSPMRLSTMRGLKLRPFFIDHSTTRPSVLMDTRVSPRSTPLLTHLTCISYVWWLHACATTGQVRDKTNRNSGRYAVERMYTVSLPPGIQLANASWRH